MYQIQEGDKFTTITRRDLSLGYQAVQSAHALADFAIEHTEPFKSWQLGSNYLVCLTVETEEELKFLAKRLKCFGIKITEFREPDIGNELTAIAVECMPKKEHSKLFKNLKLLS